LASKYIGANFEYKFQTSSDGAADTELKVSPLFTDVRAEADAVWLCIVPRACVRTPSDSFSCHGGRIWILLVLLLVFFILLSFGIRARMIRRHDRRSEKLPRMMISFARLSAGENTFEPVISEQFIQSTACDWRIGGLVVDLSTPSKQSRQPSISIRAPRFDKR